LELARSLELRSGAYHAPALPVELYQRSWRGDSNADHGLTRPALFPLSYTSTNSGERRVSAVAPELFARAQQRSWRSPRKTGGGGENCTPDDLLCRQTPCCLGYTASTLERSTGIAPVLPDWRSGVLLLYELRLERAARVELASSGWRPEAPAAIPCSLSKTLAGVTGFEPAKTDFGDQRPSRRVLTPVAVATGVEPVPPDRQSGILPLDSATTFNLAARAGFEPA
jgi:hypothetical protein